MKGLREYSFNPERGTGQGDIHSPFNCFTVLDVLLMVLDHQQPPPDHFHLHRIASATLPAPSVTPTICNLLDYSFWPAALCGPYFGLRHVFQSHNRDTKPASLPLRRSISIATARRHRVSSHTRRGMGYPRGPNLQPGHLQEPGRNLPNQPQRFHLPSAHETETHNHHPCSVH